MDIIEGQWQEVALSGADAEALSKAQGVMASLRQRIYEQATKAAKVPAGCKLTVGYKFGRFSVGCVKDDGKKRSTSSKATFKLA